MHGWYLFAQIIYYERNLREAAKRSFSSGHSTKACSPPPPPPLGLVVKRTATNIKKKTVKKKVFFS